MRLFIFILLLCINSKIQGQDCIKINVHSYQVLPNNNGLENRLHLQQCINSLKSKPNIELFFPKGNYLFQFTEADSTIIIALDGKRKLKLIGENKSKLIMDNENPTNQFSLFTFTNSDTKSNVYMDSLQLVGPQNPGSEKEKNKITAAITILQGNLDVAINHLIISGNFFKGISSSGGNKNYCRKLNVRNSQIEAYGAFSVGMFGSGTCNELICDRVLFLRCGLASNETSDKQAFGVSVYCHPDVSTLFKNCKFYNNHRNSIQFASGTKIYNQQYRNASLSNTKYQIFEGNYFDSTATDGIQLGFYYPNAIIRNNIFYNKFYGVEIVHSATIENNYFGKTVAAAITHTTESLVTNESEIKINIKNNHFYSNKAIYIYNNTKKGLCKSIYSKNNTYYCFGQSIALGSAIVGDSSTIYFYSLKDSFNSTKNGGFFLGYSFKVYIDSPTVMGTRFIYVGANPLNKPLMDTNSIVFISHMNCPINEEYGETIFNNSNGAQPRVEVHNSYIHSLLPTNIIGNYSASRNNYIYPRNAVYPFDIEVKSTIGSEINTNYNTYILRGLGTIDNISLFNNSLMNTIYDWQLYFAGQLTFNTKNDIQLTDKGNILSNQLIKANSSFRVNWLRDKKKWEIIEQ
jgi:hypothetical protein